jgi:hypothetical protein
LRSKASEEASHSNKRKDKARGKEQGRSSRVDNRLWDKPYHEGEPPRETQIGSKMNRVREGGDREKKT